MKDMRIFKIEKLKVYDDWYMYSKWITLLGQLQALMHTKLSEFVPVTNYKL